MKRKIPPYYVINWDFNTDSLEHYNIMPYLVDCWKEDKKRKHKLWVMWQEIKSPSSAKLDDTKMPTTYDDFKKFVLEYSFNMYWSRCEYEVIVTGWPQQKHEHKLDVYEQVTMNIDVITKHFMDYILS